MRYRSKPTECEAMRWNGLEVLAGYPPDDNSARSIVDWVNANGGEARYVPADEYIAAHGRSGFPRITVRTINGWAHAAPGDYIVMGSAMFTTCPHNSPATCYDYHHVRDFSKCDPETFEQRWEGVQ